MFIPPTFTLHADFHGDHESGLRCGCSLPTFPSIRHVQAIAHGCARSHCKRGLKMEVEGRDIFCFGVASGPETYGCMPKDPPHAAIAMGRRGCRVREQDSGPEP